MNSPKVRKNRAKTPTDRQGMKPIAEAAQSAVNAITIIEPSVLCEYRERHPKITERQAELVNTILQEPGTITDAATRIGADRSWAYITLKKPHVMAYATELARASLGMAALQALATQRSLLQCKSDYLKHEVSKDILDRAGFRVGSVGGRGAEVEINIKL